MVCLTVALACRARRRGRCFDSSRLRPAPRSPCKHIRCDPPSRTRGIASSSSLGDATWSGDVVFHPLWKLDLQAKTFNRRLLPHLHFHSSSPGSHPVPPRGPHPPGGPHPLAAPHPPTRSRIKSGTQRRFASCDNVDSWDLRSRCDVSWCWSERRSDVAPVAISDVRTDAARSSRRGPKTLTEDPIVTSPRVTRSVHFEMKLKINNTSIGIRYKY
jgi:hypothetical protein